MCISQNQCNLRFPKYKEGSISNSIIENVFECMENAQLRSDFKKKSLAGARTYKNDYFGAGHYI